MERNLNQANTGKPNSTASRQEQFNIFVVIRELLLLAVLHWKWFLLSVTISFSIAILYLLCTPNTYTYSTSILIKSEQTISPLEKEMQDLGLFKASSNMANELLSLKTSVVVSDIVNRLHLDVNYSRSGFFHNEVAYGLNLPVQVKFLDLNNNESASLHLSLAKDGKIILSDLTRNNQSFDEEYSTQLGKTINTPIGKISIQPSSYYEQGMNDELNIVRRPITATVNSISSKINAVLRDKNTTIIDITYKDVSTSRAEDVLNTLVAVYNENWIKDRNQVSVSTSDFIKDRLNVIEQELGSVDENISEFKSQNLMPDVQKVGDVALTQAMNAEQQSRELDNRIYMTRYILDHLSDSRNADQLLPVNSGLNNPILEEQINSYNEMLMKRNKYLATSSTNNPLVKELNQNLEILRETILSSLGNELEILQTEKRTTQTSRMVANARIAANPKQQQHLLSIERQQKVKESLYLFLLQKREENELSQAFTAYNTRVIEPPHYSGVPVEPVKASVLLIALCLGILVPIGILFIRDNLNTTVRSRKDFKHLTIPFIGEIPQIELAESKKDKKNRHRNEKPQIVVQDKNRNFINEAFRVMRSNLEFALGSYTKNKIIMLTGVNEGAGKTFITLNLSKTLGLKGAKVILLDLDLRKASLSNFVGNPAVGLTCYLSGQNQDYKQFIQHVEDIDILPCGAIPPNPTELLYSGRMKELLDELQTQYDYIFLDCPPVEIVADASIVNQYADITLFVVRSQLTERLSMIDIEQWYKEGRYKQLSIILNGTSEPLGRYGYRRYGYHKYGVEK